MTTKELIQQFAREILAANPKFSAKQIADAVFAKIYVENIESCKGYSFRTIYDYCKPSNLGERVIELVDEDVEEVHWWDEPGEPIDEEERYRHLEKIESPSNVQNAYIDWSANPIQYIFDLYQKKKECPVFDIPADQVQALVEAYVYAGKGMTGKQVCRMMYERYSRKLTHDYFKNILLALGVDKNSTPFAPHRFKTHTVEENTKTWREKEEADLEIYQRATSSEHWRKRALELKKQIHDTEHYLESLPFVDININVKVNTSDSNPQDEHRIFKPVIILSDWHGGKWVGLDYNNFDMEILTQRLKDYEDQVVDAIKMYSGLGTVHSPQWLVLGDMIDGPMGDMHPQQGIHQDVHNDEQVEFVHLLLVSTITRIEERIKHLTSQENEKIVAAVPGNHGRSTRDRRDDPVRTIERVLYKWCDSNMRDHRWVLPEPATDRYVNLFDEDLKYQITIFHGDEAPKDWRSILFHHRDLRAQYHLLVHGHWHRFEYSEDRHGVCVGVGSPVGIEDYGHNMFAGGGRPQQLLVMFEEGRGFYVPGQIIL